MKRGSLSIARVSGDVNPAGVGRNQASRLGRLARECRVCGCRDSAPKAWTIAISSFFFCSLAPVPTVAMIQMRPTVGQFGHATEGAGQSDRESLSSVLSVFVNLSRVGAVGGSCLFHS